MPINVKSFAVKAAVIWFFITGIIGWMNELDPLCICSRASLGFVGVYAVGIIAGKIINSVLIDALVSQTIEQHKENNDVNAG